jgi:hypothetical protein
MAPNRLLVNQSIHLSFLRFEIQDETTARNEVQYLLALQNLQNSVAPIGTKGL